MGLQLDYFYTLTPRQFDNTLAGFRKKQDETLKHLWEQTRQVMWAALLPHQRKGSNLTAGKVLPFPWDTPDAGDLPDEERMAEMVREVNASQDFWAKADKIKNKTKASYGDLMK